MKVNISRKKSGLKYAPKLNKGWEWTRPFIFPFPCSRFKKGFSLKYSKLRPIELNEGLPF